MENFFKKTWDAIKGHWEGLVAIIGAIFAFFLFQKQESGFVDRQRELQDAHDASIRQIEDARREEQRKYEESLKKLQQTLDAVRLQYDAAKKTLDDSKQKEIKEIVNAYADKPDELAKKLSEVTGFVIILPPQ